VAASKGTPQASRLPHQPRLSSRPTRVAGRRTRVEPAKAASEPVERLEPRRPRRNAKATREDEGGAREAQKTTPAGSRLVDDNAALIAALVFLPLLIAAEPSVEASATRGGRRSMAPWPVAGVPPGPSAACTCLGIAQPDCWTRDRNVGIGVDVRRKGI
jgi:hypothetical protein